MNTEPDRRLIKLGETDETVADVAEDIRGRDVRDSAGDDIGKINDLLIDADERKVRFLEVESGGFLGMGKDTTLIPVDAITSITEDDVRIGPSRDQVAGAPSYDPALVAEPDHYAATVSYYGFMPFWSVGYRYPDYPHYA